jgi:hypothetical protein
MVLLHRVLPVKSRDARDFTGTSRDVSEENGIHGTGGGKLPQNVEGTRPLKNYDRELSILARELYEKLELDGHSSPIPTQTGRADSRPRRADSAPHSD